jgi:hypothetical protein
MPVGDQVGPVVHLTGPVVRPKEQVRLPGLVRHMVMVTTMVMAMVRVAVRPVGPVLPQGVDHPVVPAPVMVGDAEVANTGNQ